MASVLESFSEGFRLTSAHYRMFFVPTLALVFMQAVAYVYQQSTLELDLFSTFVFTASIGFFGAAAQVWIYSQGLAVVTHRKHPFRWSAALALWGYLILVTLMVWTLSFIMGVSIAMSVGLLPIALVLLLFWQALLVYVLIRFTWFIPEIASDRREHGAVERTFQLTSGHFWQIVWFMVLSIIVAIAGLFALGVGILFAIPMTVVASVHYYEQLRKEYKRSKA